MNMFIIILVAVAMVPVGECTVNPGVQIRLTGKGLDYVVKVATEIMTKDLKEKSFDGHGESGNVRWELKDLRIQGVAFRNMKLQPVKGVGIRGEFSGIDFNGRGNVHYRYKKGWIKISDGVDVSFSARNIHMTIIIPFGVDNGGHPTVSLQSCQAGVDDVSLDFHGGLGWLYNLFSRFLENKIKDKFRDMLCKLIQKEIDHNAKSTLATFPVTKVIDKWAEIDYRLTDVPSFTSEYMDIFLKGEFKSSTSPKESSLVAPKLSLSSDHDKMVFFWVTDYTINTAGRIYQASNLFDIMFQAWDKKTPDAIKKFLNTKDLAYLIPALQKKYPGRPMAMQLLSYKAPEVQIRDNSMKLLLFVHAILSVEDKSGTVDEVLRIKFDMYTDLNVAVHGDRIGGKIVKLDYTANVFKSSIGKVNIPLDNPFVKTLLQKAIISKANPLLEKGFPLPNLDKVALENLEIKLQRNVIRIGTDIKYNR